MSGIGGKKRENNGEFSRKVGLFTATVIAINPTEKEYKDVLGMELKEGSKACEYLSEREGNTVLRVDFWIETQKNSEGHSDRFKLSYFLEDKLRTNKDETKVQFINEIGNCAWAEDESTLPEWFTKRDYRQAYHGEEDFYEFVRAWLNKLDYRDSSTVLMLDWKKLMKGNTKELREQIDGEWSGEVGCMATVVVKDEEGEVKEYQGVFNRGFFPAYSMKHFRVVDYDNEDVIDALKDKLSKDLKPFERFILKVTGEYGCKDFFKFKDLKDYDPSENPVETDSTISDGAPASGGTDY